MRRFTRSSETSSDLGNERLSYRNLYEEQIGSVYEALMGYYTMRVESPSFASNRVTASRADLVSAPRSY